MTIAPQTVAVLGATGFVGRQVCAELAASGHTVVEIVAPRMRTRARNVSALEAALRPRDVDQLGRALQGAEVVINCAGLASPLGGDLDTLFGANALLPALLAASIEDRATRLVHVSSAAVQGAAQLLDESTEVSPFSHYSASKALGEQVLTGRDGHHVVRPTSVHGPGRSTTAALIRLARSRVASVAGDGLRPTPQVLVENTASAIVFVALRPDARAIVLQPSDGLTTGELLRLLGGKEPRHLPVATCRTALATLIPAARASQRAAGSRRRLEMLWFGQAQVGGWLTEAGWRPRQGRSDWLRLPSSFATPPSEDAHA